ncbi:hypothetical protein Q7P37_003746 [Cladosporium fusiforme]
MPLERDEAVATKVVHGGRQENGSASSTSATNQPVVFNPIGHAPRGPKAHNPSQRRSGGWDRQNALVSNLAAARAPSNAPKGPRPKSFIIPRQATPSAAASARMSNLQLNSTTSSCQSQNWQATINAPTQIYNPSIGPTQSTMTTPWRNSTASQTCSAHSTHTKPPSTQICKISNLTRRDFRLGDLISAPFHIANTNPHVDPSDARLALTIEGPVYSKRRMLVVLFIFAQDLYCLPLYSFGDRGLRAKPDHLHGEYVCVANEGEEKGFVNQSPHRFVVVSARRRVAASTTLHLTGGVRVGCNEDITAAGRLTRDTYFDLVELWQRVVKDASREPWEWIEGGA